MPIIFVTILMVLYFYLQKSQGYSTGLILMSYTATFLFFVVFSFAMAVFRDSLDNMVWKTTKSQHSLNISVGISLALSIIVPIFSYHYIFKFLSYLF